MKPSAKCIQFIKEREALRLKSYVCAAGHWTIGYGSLLHENGTPVKKGDVITEAQADRLLMKEVEEKTKELNVLVKGLTITQGMYDALVSFGYNTGMGGLKGSTLLKKVKANPNDKTMIPYSACNETVKNWMDKKKLKEINTIHYEFMSWVKARDPKTGERRILEGLQIRRDMEYKIFIS